MKKLKIGDLNLVLEGTERDDLIGISVKPDSLNEKWLCKKIFPKVVKDKVVIRLGALFGEHYNTYLLTPEDYKRVEALINKRETRKDIIKLGTECAGMIIGCIVAGYICEAIKNHF